MCLLAMGPVGSAQVPAGPPFDPDIHPNPIVTFVRSSDFAPTTCDEAADNAGIEIVGLSSGTATRESIEITEGSVDEVKILGRDIETLFFPVVRQRFELKAGGTLTLYSFRDPSPDIADRFLISVLNQHAFASEDDPEKARFGGVAAPEQLGVLGVPALLFNNDGELTLFWQDRNTSYVADSTIDPDALLRLVEDLL